VRPPCCDAAGWPFPLRLRMRHLTIEVLTRHNAAAPSPGPAPIRQLVEAGCEASPSKYFGNPTGVENTADRVSDRSAAAALAAAEWGDPVRVSGIDVVPETDYKVHVASGSIGSPTLSASASASTTMWGDVVGDFDGLDWTPPDDVADFVDISSVVDAFRNDSDAPAVFRADLAGASGSECRPDRGIDFLDITGAVDAFRGISHAESTLCPEACP